MPEPAGLPRVVATDLDGTLLRSDGTLSPRSRAAIRAVEELGVVVVFVTARPPRWLDDLADAVGPHGLAVCANGAFVYDVARRTVVETHPIAAADVLRLAGALRAAVPGVVLATEHADGMIREPGFPPRGDVAAVREVDAIEAAAADSVGKLLARCVGLDAVELHDRVAGAVDGAGELAYSGAVGLAEITAPGVTKAAGATRWCAGQGVDTSDVWAFGDMPNDLPLLRWAGVSYAVENAHPEVLAAADHTCASNDDDGVARVLEHLVHERQDR